MRVAGLVAVLLLVAGCASNTPGDPPNPSPSPSPAWWSRDADVAAVRPGNELTSVVLDVELPAGGPGCARDLTVHRLTETDQQVLANVTFSTTDASDQGGCPDRTPVAATLTAAAPFGQRAIVLNSGRSPWIRAGDGYRPCHPILGCAPPADHCAERWVKTATGQIDMPEHTAWQVRGCDGLWLAVDGDAAAGACGPVDGGPPPACTATPQVTRFFFRFRYLRWTVVANTKAGGCVQVQRNDPGFPTELCRRLPPTG